MDERGCTSVITDASRRDPAPLSDLLARSAGGDRAAFADFYDATCDLVWQLELRRWRARGAAEAATRHRYVSAWHRAGQHAASGLSATAWLLSLPEPELAG